MKPALPIALACSVAAAWLLFAWGGAAPKRPAASAVHSHPITAEHLALYRDVDLLDGAWQAMRGGEVSRARQLLDQHRRAYQRVQDDMREGLALLADCMDEPSSEARSRAQRFYDEQTHSMMRRRLRLHCLEAGAGPRP